MGEKKGLRHILHVIWFYYCSTQIVFLCLSTRDEIICFIVDIKSEFQTSGIKLVNQSVIFHFLMFLFVVNTEANLSFSLDQDRFSHNENVDVMLI